MKISSDTQVTIVGIAILIGGIAVLPLALGATYATIAVPIYGVVCGHSATAFLNPPLKWKDYDSFLINAGCTIQEVEDRYESNVRDCMNDETPVECRLRVEDESEEIDVHDFPRWDLPYRLFFRASTTVGAMIIPLLNENVLVRGLYYILYMAVVMVASKYLGIYAGYLFNKTTDSSNKK